MSDPTRKTMQSTTGRKTRGAVIVTRVSTGEQDRHGTSPETQLDACRKRAVALSLPVVAEYYDGGISGAFLLSRPGMQAAIAAIQAGRADTLLCPNIDRYSRDRGHQEQIKKAVRAAGGQLVFCDMDYQDTAAGNLQFNIRGDFAVYERELFRERSMAGRRRRAEQGQQPCRSWSPYGYHVPTKADVMRGDYPLEQLGAYVVLEREADVVRRIFAGYAAGTHSLAALTRELNAEGVPTAKGAALWCSMSVRHILKNPVYTGKGLYGKGRCSTDEARLTQRHQRTGLPLTSPHSRVPAPEEEWTVIPAPALVDRETWDRAQEHLAGNRAKYGGNPKTARLLSGRLRCPLCGGTAHRTTYSDGRPPVYSCLTHRERKRERGEDFCSPTRYLESVQEEATVRAVVDACERREWVIAAVIAYAAPDAPATDAAALRREVAALDLALKELEGEEGAAVRGQIEGIRAGASPAAYGAVFADIAARRKDLGDRRGLMSKHLAASRGSAPAKQAGSVDMAQVVADVRRVLTSPLVSGRDQRDALGQIVEKVVARKDGADVYFLPGLFVGDTVNTLSRRLMPR